MSKEEELKENEEHISRDDLDIEVYSGEEEGSNVVWVKFSGFDNEEEADDYAETLSEILPLLLFETTRIQ